MGLMREEEFLEFGMTPTEAKVYLEIIKLKESTIGPIIKRTGLHRGSVYNAIDDLIKKGFVNFIDEEKIRIYTPSGKEIFNTLLEQRKKEAANKEKAINSFFDEIQKIQETEKKQNVRVYYGIPAFKTLFLDIYKECKENNWEYYFQGQGGEMQDAVGEAFYKYTQDLKRKMKIKCKIILDKKTKNYSYHSFVHGNIRYIESNRNSPVNIWIYGDSVLLVLFGTNPLISVKIKSEITSEAFKSYFESLWGISETLKDLKDTFKGFILMIENSKQMDILNRDVGAPYFIYPHDEENFKKYRDARKRRKKTSTGIYDLEIFRAYKKLWHKKIPIRYIFTNEALNLFFDIILDEFGKAEARRRINQILLDLKKYNVKIRVLKEYNPLSIYLTQEEYLTMLPGKEEIFGFKTGDKSILDTYRKLYGQYWERAEELEACLNRIKTSF